MRLSLLPPGRQCLTECSYQYPLKLVAPDPHTGHEEKHVTVVFLLTYGGGLVGGDKIDLTVELEPLTQLVLLTQGSTKIFKSLDPSIVSAQILDVTIGAGATLVYLPDPTQPFGQSIYEQRQTFHVDSSGTSNLLLLDSVSEGRPARDESWHLTRYRGRNEIRAGGRLILRDAIQLSNEDFGGSGLGQKMGGKGITGTLIIYGPLFKALGDFFMHRFQSQPRIGAKNFTQDEKSHMLDIMALQEKVDGVLWTASNIRGIVLVKFGAKEVDGARRWLGRLLREEGSVERLFGHQALLCLR